MASAPCGVGAFLFKGARDGIGYVLADTFFAWSGSSMGVSSGN